MAFLDDIIKINQSIWLNIPKDQPFLFLLPTKKVIYIVIALKIYGKYKFIISLVF